VAKRLTKRARVLRLADALFHKIEDFTLYLMIEFLEVLDGASSYSIVQANLPPDLGGGVALAAIFEASFGEVAVLEVLNVFLDEFGGVEGLGATGLPCEAREAPFERGFQADGKHRYSP